MSSLGFGKYGEFAEKCIQKYEQNGVGIMKYCTSQYPKYLQCCKYFKYLQHLEKPGMPNDQGICGSPGSSMGRLLGLESRKKDEPYRDLRNEWGFQMNGMSNENVIPSTYQADYTVPPPLDLVGVDAERKRFAAMLPPKYNSYRPHAANNMQHKDDFIPKRNLQYHGDRNPCRRDPMRHISNVHLDHGFGPYISETREQYDRPMALTYGQPVCYELPSGYSTQNGTPFWSTNPTRFSFCTEAVTPPHQYNPWPRYSMGHVQFLHESYRPKDTDYKEVTVVGTGTFNTRTFII